MLVLASAWECAAAETVEVAAAAEEGAQEGIRVFTLGCVAEWVEITGCGWGAGVAGLQVGGEGRGGGGGRW